MGYNFIDQNIVASCLIQSYTDDSFYNPTSNSHTGFAFDGNYYSLGVLVPGHPQASWFTEFGTNSFRGNQAAFPAFGIVLLSPVSLVILNQTNSVAHAEDLPLWMQFVLGDNNALANDFDSSVQGFLPSKVTYADGIVSVTYTPDAGNQPYRIVANITQTSITSNVLTVTAVNEFSVGQNVRIEGTQENFLNGQVVTVTNSGGSNFTANFAGSNYTNTTDSGTATPDPLLPPFPPPYPNVPVQSRMVVSIDFVQDSVYLDVAV